MVRNRRRWILKEVPCANHSITGCTNTILQVHKTGKAKCEECFKEQMNVYRRGIRNENVCSGINSKTPAPKTQ